MHYWIGIRASSNLDQPKKLHRHVFSRMKPRPCNIIHESNNGMDRKHVGQIENVIYYARRYTALHVFVLKQKSYQKMTRTTVFVALGAGFFSTIQKVATAIFTCADVLLHYDPDL